MYASPKNNFRKIIFLIIANIILLFVILLLFSLLMKWDLTKVFSWIPLVDTEEYEEEIVEKSTDPMVLEKSDLEKREEYLNAKEQQLNLLKKEIENKNAELKAYKSELDTLREELEKEKKELNKQKTTLSNEEERYRMLATTITNMNVTTSAELLLSDEVHIFDVIQVLLMLDRMAEEAGNFSITPAILQEMKNIENQNAVQESKSAKIINWIARYDMMDSEGGNTIE